MVGSLTRVLGARAPVLIALVRYGLVGVANAATYYLAYLSVLSEVGYLTAHVIGLGAAMVVSFLLNCRFTFRVRPSWRRFLLYPASQAVNIGATTVGVISLVALDVDERIAPLAAAVLAVPVSFLAARAVLNSRLLSSPHTEPIPVVVTPTATPPDRATDTHDATDTGDPDDPATLRLTAVRP